MNATQFGVVVRMSRIRRGWRQEDLAEAAGVTRTDVSRVERGRFDNLPFWKIKAVAAPLEIRVELLAKSRGADLDRMVGSRHSAMAELVLRWLAGLMWAARPEVSFSVYGERGVVDIVAWNAERRALLIIELKTEIVDVGQLAGTLDRKVRLAYKIAASLDLGWKPEVVGVCLLVSDTMTNRRAIAKHAATFGALLLDDGRAVLRWLKDPSRPLRGLRFVSNVQLRAR
ncbi:MAG: helix-turn-helix domain-containing protein [Chloroflexi bacterium]|nr:helix-turn-helix domain-containing protein [Chloroflexota bacterium]